MVNISSNLVWYFLKLSLIFLLGEHPKLVHSAAHFLVTLTGTVRPPSIWKLKEFTDLYSGVQHLKLQPEAHRLIVR